MRSPNNKALPNSVMWLTALAVLLSRASRSLTNLQKRREAGSKSGHRNSTSGLQRSSEAVQLRVRSLSGLTFVDDEAPQEERHKDDESAEGICEHHAPTDGADKAESRHRQVVHQEHDEHEREEPAQGGAALSSAGFQAIEFVGGNIFAEE
jgi:hypothetical protein